MTVAWYLGSLQKRVSAAVRWWLCFNYLQKWCVFLWDAESVGCCDVFHFGTLKVWGAVMCFPLGCWKCGVLWCVFLWDAESVGCCDVFSFGTRKVWGAVMCFPLGRWKWGVLWCVLLWDAESVGCCAAVHRQTCSPLGSWCTWCWPAVSTPLKSWTSRTRGTRALLMWVQHWWCALFVLSAISTRVLVFSLTPVPRRPVPLGKTWCEYSTGGVPYLCCLLLAQVCWFLVWPLSHADLSRLVRPDVTYLCCLPIARVLVFSLSLSHADLSRLVRPDVTYLCCLPIARVLVFSLTPIPRRPVPLVKTWCDLFVLSAISTRVLVFSLTPIPRRPVPLGKTWCDLFVLSAHSKGAGF